MSEINVSAMLKIHSNALVNMSMSGIIGHLETLKGSETPQGEYARGYRDAIDLMLIQVRQIQTNFNNLGTKNQEDEPNE